MASVLFTVRDAIVNTLAFSGTNFVFSRIKDHGEEELKRLDLALGKLKSVRDEWSKDRMKRHYFINEKLRKKKTQGQTLTMLMKQCLTFSGI